ISFLPISDPMPLPPTATKSSALASKPQKNPARPLFSLLHSQKKSPSGISKTISLAFPKPIGSSRSSPKISKSSANSSPALHNSANPEPSSPQPLPDSPYTSSPNQYPTTST